MKILDLYEGERPREKMLSKGAGALSDGELLAILISSGTREESALDIASRMLSETGGSLGAIASKDIRALTSFNGIGTGKACTLAAAFELGRRFVEEGCRTVRTPIVTSSQVYSLMRPAMKGLKHEECWALILNSSSYLTERCRLTVGADSSTIIDIRQVVRTVLEKGARALILVHNHPTGNPRPSQADVRETDALKKACEACGLELYDHVIVCDDCWYSFAEERIGTAGK